MAVLERAGETVAAAPVRRPAGDVAALELDGAFGRPVEAAEHVHERRLAGAVRPDEADDLTAAQLEGHAPKRLDAGERAGEFFLILLEIYYFIRARIFIFY